MLMRFLILAAMLLPLPATAQGVERPIHVIMPIAPGGGTDVVARVLVELVSVSLVQPIALEAAWRMQHFQTQLARTSVTSEWRGSDASSKLITGESEALARSVRQIGIERTC